MTKPKSKRDVKSGNPQFVICDHKGVQITFANGVCISIQWGPGNYCADYWQDPMTSVMDYRAPERTNFWRSPDAEVALFWAGEGKVGGEGKEWLTKEAYGDLNHGEDPGDDVLPGVTPDEVVRYIAWAAARAPRQDP